MTASRIQTQNEFRTPALCEGGRDFTVNATQCREDGTSVAHCAVSYRDELRAPLLGCGVGPAVAGFVVTTDEALRCDCVEDLPPRRKSKKDDNRTGGNNGGIRAGTVVAVGVVINEVVALV